MNTSFFQPNHGDPAPLKPIGINHVHRPTHVPPAAVSINKGVAISSSLSGQYYDGENVRDTFAKVQHPSRNRTEAQGSGLNHPAPVCAELVCVAALSSQVSRGACVVAERVQAVQRKEGAVGGGHDAGQVRFTEGNERAGVGGETLRGWVGEDGWEGGIGRERN
jgi:hypothetical protein